jgi:hypothetical protein
MADIEIGDSSRDTLQALADAAGVPLETYLSSGGSPAIRRQSPRSTPSMAAPRRRACTAGGLTCAVDPPRHGQHHPDAF